MANGGGSRRERGEACLTQRAGTYFVVQYQDFFIFWGGWCMDRTWCIFYFVIHHFYFVVHHSTEEFLLFIRFHFLRTCF